MEKDTNLVIFDKYSKLTPCFSVVIGDRKAAYTAVEHLIKKGERELIILEVHSFLKTQSIVF